MSGLPLTILPPSHLCLSFCAPRSLFLSLCLCLFPASSLWLFLPFSFCLTPILPRSANLSPSCCSFSPAFLVRFFPFTCPYNHLPECCLQRIFNLFLAPYLLVLLLTSDLEFIIFQAFCIMINSLFFAAFPPSVNSRSVLPQLILLFNRFLSSSRLLEMCSNLSSIDVFPSACPLLLQYFFALSYWSLYWVIICD